MESDPDREIGKESSLSTSMDENYINGGYANDDITILEQRKDNPSGTFIMHLNINSIHNKFEELKELNDVLKAHILVISETKIGSLYPSSQFTLNGFHTYRKNRAKGGGGLIAYFSSVIPSKKLTLPRAYKTLEAVAVESKIGRTDIALLAIYRTPRPSRKGRKTSPEDKCLQKVEEEINDIYQRLCFQKQTIVIVGDLNMDRLRPDSAEGKILTNLQEVNNLECLITKPTRISVHSQTLLDVLLTNTLALFVKSGTYDPGLSDQWNM